MPALQPLAYILCCDWSKVIGMRRRQVVVIATSVGVFSAVVGWRVDPTGDRVLLAVPVAVVVVAVVLGRCGDGR